MAHLYMIQLSFGVLTATLTLIRIFNKKGDAKNEKNNITIIILLITIIALSVVTGCVATDSSIKATQTFGQTAFASNFPPAVRTEEGLARAMQGDYSDVYNPLKGDPDPELAQKNIQNSGLGMSDFYYRPRQHPDMAKLGAIYLYEEWIVFGYTSTDPAHPTPKTGENFNITWYTDSNYAQTQFENGRKVLAKLVESDDKSGYFYSYSEMPDAESDEIDMTYTVLWMQDGYCFMANMPARYGLEHILDLCDMEAVDSKTTQ